MSKTSPVASASLPRLSQLLIDAWELTTARFGPVLLLWIVQGVLMIAVFAAILFTFMSALLPAIINGSTAAEIASDPTAGMVFTGVVNAVVYTMILSLIFGAFFQGSTIALTASDKKIGVGEALNMGFKRFFPVLAVCFLLYLLIIGGLILFLIPGLVMVVLLSFSLYEVVLYNVSPVQALRASVAMVWPHFWGVLGRMLALMGVALGISFLGSLIGSMEGGSQSMFTSLLMLVVNLVYSVYSVMYSVALYRQLRKTPAAKSSSLAPLTIVSVLGWVGLGLWVSNFLQTM